LRVGIDGLHLFGNYAGVKGSVAALISSLRKHHPSDEIVLYVPRDFNGPPYNANDPGLILRKAFFPGRWRTIRTIWRNFRLQSRTYADHCDVIHGPVYALPGFLSKPGVVTVHDVIPFTHPLFCTPGSARVQTQTIPRSVKVARRVIVPSLAAKEELLRNVKEATENKIDVIPWAADECFVPVSDAATREQARLALSLPEKYVLFVGNIEPKKNLHMLIQAFFAAKMNKKLPHKLVIAGQVGWKMDNIEKLIRELNAQEFVLFTGYVPQAALPALYSLADVFVMPSVVEGFGIPVLEAMACGCPVIISPDPALREVAGSAARVAPYDGTRPFLPLREAIEEILLNSKTAADYAEKGLKRAKVFTWERTARLTRESYEKALGS
jgi:glycosyltransferase involved in cell wall biosynthesis